MKAVEKVPFYATTLSPWTPYRQWLVRDAVKRGALITAGLGLLLFPGAAASGNPWQPNCKATPSEQPLPTTLQPAARAFFPWVPKLKALRAGPFYLIALSTQTAR